jgi:hypothetical protein
MTKRFAKTRDLAGCFLAALLTAGLLRADGGPAAAAAPVRQGLQVSKNGHYLEEAGTGRPVFVLADTAWNLSALRLDEIDTYLRSRAGLGFNLVMFTLNFAPQAEEKNAYGQAAYLGPEKTDLNPAYFATVDFIVKQAGDQGLYVMIYSMWAGEKAGTMNHYSAAQLARLGKALGRHFAGVPNVILCAGGESSPPYIDADRVNAMGRGLKEGCAGRNLVTVHPVSGNSASKFYANSAWLDFYLIQAKSGNGAKNAAYDAAALVLRDWSAPVIKPTMMGEHRYESGTEEDPLIQRRSLYQCVFAGGCGYAYGHDAIWQMTPHTAQPWMLKGWNPGVRDWREALDTPAVRQLKNITALLYTHPYRERIPDQSLVLDGQGSDVLTRVQATRDGSPGRRDATYLFAYLSAPRAVTLDTGPIAGRTLTAYWFSPETARTEMIGENLPNSGRLWLGARAEGRDGVVVVEDAAKHYPRPR